MPKRGQLKSNASERSKQQRKYNSTPEQKKNRAARNQARAEKMKSGAVRKGDGKDVGHITPLKRGGKASSSNTKVQSVASNRSEGGRIGDKKKKAAGGRKGGRA